MTLKLTKGNDSCAVVFFSIPAALRDTFLQKTTDPQKKNILPLFTPSDKKDFVCLLFLLGGGTLKVGRRVGKKPNETLNVGLLPTLRQKQKTKQVETGIVQGNVTRR